MARGTDGDSRTRCIPPEHPVASAAGLRFRAATPALPGDFLRRRRLQPRHGDMTPCLALALLLHQAAGRAPARVAGEVGRAVLLAADAAPGFQRRDVIWRWLAAGEELVATRFGGAGETRYESRFRGRCRLHENLSLEIGSLELGDSGTFSALLVDARGRTERSELQLTVHEPVTEVTVEVFVASERRGGLREPCEAFLSCVATGGTNVTYSWVADDAGHVLGDTGQVLRASLEPSQHHVAFTCTATNAVSRATSTAVLPWEHCHRAGLPKATCHVGDILLIAAPVLVLAAAALAATAVVCARCHRGKPLTEPPATGCGTEAAAG